VHFACRESPGTTRIGERRVTTEREREREEREKSKKLKEREEKETLNISEDPSNVISIRYG
jgi:hypothetical protein